MPSSNHIMYNLFIFLFSCRFEWSRHNTYVSIRRAADIINHSSSERRSIFNASHWSKLSTVTGFFTACLDAHSPAVELDNMIQSGLLQAGSRTQGIAPNSPAVLVIFSFKTCQLGILACSMNTNLNYEITILFIRTGTNKSQQSHYSEKGLLTFSKVQNKQLGTRLVSGYTKKYGNNC